MASICTSNVTSGFIDLATFDEIEKYLYGGADATAYFVRETRRSTWFTQVPVVLSRASGSPAFGQEWSVSISRAGDYMLQTWLRVTTPAVTLQSENNAGNTAARCRWTRNLMHNLIRECCITFNDLVAARFDNYHLDFWAAFTVPAGKRNGYNNMIGNVDDLTAPHIPGPTNSIPSMTLNLPLPFFYSRDSGVALPAAALPYNEMRIQFAFRDWDQLLILENSGVTTGEQRVNPLASDFGGAPVIGNTQVWANYAIVSNDERKRMACAPRDILIEQVQTAPVTSYDVSQVRSQDIRFSHAIKVLFFSARNKTYNGVWSNYRSLSNIVSACKVPCKGTDGCGYTHMLIPPTKLRSGVDSVDPIDVTSLTYENTLRLGNMGSDYFMFVQPWYHAPRIPVVTGYHMYSYSLDFICLDPLGSTNYGKLTNVSIVPEASTAAITAAGAYNAESNPNGGQTYEFIVTAVNNNIIRISGGALGFPVL